MTDQSTLKSQLETLTMSSPKFETYKLGDWHLQCGASIPDAYIAYKTFGDPKSPAIVYPTWYSGCKEDYISLVPLKKPPLVNIFAAIYDNVWLIGEDKTLNPKKVPFLIFLSSLVLDLLFCVLIINKYFIIIPALFGNGESSSPSNHPTLKNFPKVSFYDNVRAQHELVTKYLGIQHLRAVLGWSM